MLVLAWVRGMILEFDVAFREQGCRTPGRKREVSFKGTISGAVDYLDTLSVCSIVCVCSRHLIGCNIRFLFC